MKKRIVILSITWICFNISVINAQDESATPHSIDSLEHFLTQLNNNYSDFTEALEILDKKAKQKELSNYDYYLISEHILENDLRNGYNFILENALLFQDTDYMELTSIMQGDSSVIYKVLKYLTSDKAKSLINHILYSDYLSRELSKDELDIVSVILRLDGLDGVSKVMHDSTRVSNLKAIINFGSN